MSKTRDEKYEKQQKKKCFGCLQGHPTNELELTCDQGHVVAGQCLQTYLTMALSRENWETSMPLRCPMCSKGHAPYHPGAITALLTEEQAALYSQADVRLSVNPGELLVGCPFCSYAEIYDGDNVPVLLHCKRTECSKHSCTVCFKEYDPEEEALIMPHLTVCDVFKDIHREVQDVIRSGTTNSCPHCGCSGQKDDNCSHMTCNRCQGEWCYICGEKAMECNLSRGTAWPIGHSVHWRRNPRRCPMYVREFSKINPLWGDAPESELAFYHRYKTMRLLKGLLVKWGPAKITDLLQHFPEVLGGYDLSDVEAWDEDEFLSNRGLGRVPPVTRKRRKL